jgi:hypothetical protein
LGTGSRIRSDLPDVLTVEEEFLKHLLSAVLFIAATSPAWAIVSGSNAQIVGGSNYYLPIRVIFHVLTLVWGT